MKNKIARQVLHKIDNGEVILVARSKSEWSFVCKKCAIEWKISTILLPLGDLPSDMMIIKEKDGIKVTNTNK